MIIDTNILIDFFRGKEEAVKFIGQFNSIVTSVIVASELYAGIQTGHEMRELKQFLESSVELIPVSIEIAEQAGFYRNKYGKSHGIRLPDAFIAATAITKNLPIASLDKKHFSVLTDKLIVPY